MVGVYHLSVLSFCSIDPLIVVLWHGQTRPIVVDPSIPICPHCGPCVRAYFLFLSHCPDALSRPVHLFSSFFVLNGESQTYPILWLAPVCVFRVVVANEEQKEAAEELLKAAKPEQAAASKPVAPEHKLQHNWAFFFGRLHATASVGVS